MWVLDKVAGNEKFFENMLFSDECTFRNNGHVNRHNFHYYFDTNPPTYRIMKNQNRWPVNVWGGILGQYLIGPYFFEGHLNEDVPFNIRTNMWLLLDGAPPHYHCEVRQFLIANFKNRRIGRNGSPGLTPLDFFLWGYIKGIVYHTLPTTSHDLKTRIRDAFKT
ncbi:hypothetical protein D910_00889, partial [Dendroctonus ponderosae]